MLDGRKDKWCWNIKIVAKGTYGECHQRGRVWVTTVHCNREVCVENRQWEGEMRERKQRIEKLSVKFCILRYIRLNISLSYVLVKFWIVNDRNRFWLIKTNNQKKGGGRGGTCGRILDSSQNGEEVFDAGYDMHLCVSLFYF